LETHSLLCDNDDGSDRLELFNLRDDVGESKNRAAENPELVRELNDLIDGFLRDTEAVVPVRNPAYDPNPAANNAKSKAAAADPLQGWKARSCEATVKDGIVTVTGKGAAPFLGMAVGKENGPATIQLRARCASGGQGRIEWLPSGVASNAANAKSVPFSLSGGDWQEVSVDVPAQGPLGIVRVHLPAQTQPVEIDWIQLKTGKKPRRWNF